MSTINANDSGKPSDNRGLNRQNHSMTEIGGRSGKNTGTSKPYVSGSNENRAMNQGTWNNKEQRDVKSTGYGSRDNKTIEKRPSGGYNREQGEAKSNTFTKYTGQNNNRDIKPANYGTRDKGSASGSGKPFQKSYGTYGKNSYSGGNGFRKDEDFESDNKHGKGHSSGNQHGEVKSKSNQSKDKELQSDKMETIKRLEKEKKVLERKNQEFNKEKENISKPQIKKKRTGNIDWTKGYAKGLYGDDDEEDYTDYF